MSQQFITNPSSSFRSFASGLLNALTVPVDDRSNSFPVPPVRSPQSNLQGQSQSHSYSNSQTQSTIGIGVNAPTLSGSLKRETSSIKKNYTSSILNETDRIAMLAVKATKRASALEKRCRVLREGLLSAVGVLEDTSAVLDELIGKPLGHWMILDEKSISPTTTSYITSTSTTTTTSSSTGDLLLKAVRQEVGSLVQKSTKRLSAVAASLSGQSNISYPEVPFVGYKLDMNLFYDDLISLRDLHPFNENEKRVNTDGMIGEGGGSNGINGGGRHVLEDDEAATLSALCASQSAQLRKLNSDLISSQREHLTTTQELRAALAAALRLADQNQSSSSSSSSSSSVLIDGGDNNINEDGYIKKTVDDAYTLQILEQLRDAKDEIERAKKRESILKENYEKTREYVIDLKSEIKRSDIKFENEVHELKKRLLESEKMATNLREKNESDRARANAVEAHSTRMFKLQLDQLEAELANLKATKDLTKTNEGKTTVSTSTSFSSPSSSSHLPSTSSFNELEKIRLALMKCEEKRLELEKKTSLQATALEEAKVLAQSSIPVQYLKSVTIHFITIAGDPFSGSKRKPLINVLATLLDFSPEERKKVGAPISLNSNTSNGTSYSLLVSPVSQEKTLQTRRIFSDVITPSSPSSSSSSSIHPFLIPSIDTIEENSSTMRTVILSPNSRILASTRSGSDDYNNEETISSSNPFPSRPGQGSVLKKQAQTATNDKETFFSKLGVI